MLVCKRYVLKRHALLNVGSVNATKNKVCNHNIYRVTHQMLYKCVTRVYDLLHFEEENTHLEQRLGRAL